MKKNKRKVIKIASLVLTLVIMGGGILSTSIISKAAHTTECSKVLYYRGDELRKSQYTHETQYGLCTVSVTEYYAHYSCNCGAEQTYSRVSRNEVHHQPHG